MTPTGHIYVVRNVVAGRIKVGRTNAPPDARLADHHLNGYTEVMWLSYPLPAVAIQRAESIALGRIAAVQRPASGNEYFDLTDTLTADLVCDFARDGWERAASEFHTGQRYDHGTKNLIASEVILRELADGRKAVGELRAATGLEWPALFASLSYIYNTRGDDYICGMRDGHEWSYCMAADATPAEREWFATWRAMQRAKGKMAGED